MDITVILASVGGLIGAVGGLYSVITGTVNKRLELVYQGQEAAIAELRADKQSLITRIEELEKKDHETQKELLACERKSHRLEMKVDRLMGMIPNGTSLEKDFQKSEDSGTD